MHVLNLRVPYTYQCVRYAKVQMHTEPTNRPHNKRISPDQNNISSSCDDFFLFSSG